MLFSTMRLLSLLVVAWLAAGAPGRADDEPIKRFDGHSSLTTADFTVPDGWEIRWRSDQVLSVGVIRLDNTVIAGTTGRNVGSLYLPQGGTYRIRVKGDDPIPWDVAVYAVSASSPPSTADNASDYYSPTEGPVYKPAPAGTAGAPSVPVVAPTPVVAPSPAPPALPAELSKQQLAAVVTIKGDHAQGAGFFMKTAGGTVLVTAQQLVSDNPNWQAFTSTGNPVQVTKIEAATDRDVVMLAVKDFGYTALEPGRPEMMKAGDSILTADANGQPLPAVTVTNIGPRRLDIDELRPVPGGPLVLASTGKVVGVVDVRPQVKSSANFQQENFDERDATVAGSVEPFGLRLDNVPVWETCDAARLQLQAQFLASFRQRTRSLDAYLNGTGDERDVKLWKSDDKMKSANDTFVQDTSGNDPNERTEALHALLFELGVVGDADFDQIQQPGNFYSFELLRAKDEIAYRQALKTQLDAYGSDATGFNTVASRNN
jgi:hypothetical protein